MGRRIADGPWIIVAVDIMDPLLRSKAGYMYILVIQDLFTKWVECRTLRAANGKSIVEALKDLLISVEREHTTNFAHEQRCRICKSHPTNFCRDARDKAYNSAALSPSG